MPSAGFEVAIPVIKQPQTYALGSTVTGIGPLLTLPSSVKWCNSYE